MVKKIIGIVGYSLGENSFGAGKAYLEFFSQFGQVKILTPQKGIEKVDLLVLPGGADANSIEYDEVPSFTNSNPDLFKEYFYRQNLKQYVQAKTPIYGICLGFQQLNVFFGGKLTQNLLYHPYYSNSRNELVHEIYEAKFNNIEETWEPTKYKKNEAPKVNSMHHQGITLNDLSQDLVPLYLTDNYPTYLVESFKHKELSIMGCQWHPEETYCIIAEEQINSLLFHEEKVLTD